MLGRGKCLQLLEQLPEHLSCHSPHNPQTFPAKQISANTCQWPRVARSRGQSSATSSQGGVTHCWCTHQGSGQAAHEGL